MRSELVKFRIRADDKRLLSEAADKAGVTLSEMLRRAGRAAAAGRIAPRAVLTDLVLIRTAANKLASLADTPDADPAVLVACAKSTADDLRTIATRHLANIR
jgi:uncharacterized protein (DUF1778 family)